MRSAADDVWMTCVHVDDVQVRMTCVDDMQMTCMCGQHAHVDDVHMTTGVVLHEIRQLRQEEGSHPEQLCIKPTGLLVVCVLYLSGLQPFSTLANNFMLCVQIYL